ncbi:hypothetical protein BJF79_02510 [Actinomadura sp. CNU-125]|nr:hypothetical protein BJF79_02510 [Actinomadura sp. CNU-125]
MQVAALHRHGSLGGPREAGGLRRGSGRGPGPGGTGVVPELAPAVEPTMTTAAVATAPMPLRHHFVRRLRASEEATASSRSFRSSCCGISVPFVSYASGAIRLPRSAFRAAPMTAVR